MTPRIDAHQHFWRIARGDYSWLTPALGAIYRDFNPEDLAPHLATHGIAATILVQAAPTHAETAFLLDLADKTAFVAGVVGWTEFAAPGAEATIARLAADPLLDPMQPGGVEAERRQEPVERRDGAPRHDGERAAEAVA